MSITLFPNLKYTFQHVSLPSLSPPHSIIWAKRAVGGGGGREGVRGGIFQLPEWIVRFRLESSGNSRITRLDRVRCPTLGRSRLNRFYKTNSRSLFKNIVIHIKSYFAPVLKRLSCTFFKVWKGNQKSKKYCWPSLGVLDLSISFHAVRFNGHFSIGSHTRVKQLRAEDDCNQILRYIPKEYTRAFLLVKTFLYCSFSFKLRRKYFGAWSNCWRNWHTLGKAQSPAYAEAAECASTAVIS